MNKKAAWPEFLANNFRIYLFILKTASYQQKKDFVLKNNHWISFTND